MKNKAILLDRDGVLNKDYVDYAYTLEKFQILPGVPEALRLLKEAGYVIVIVTNQSGIAKGIYTKADMDTCHAELQRVCNNAIDHIYFAPYHESVTASLTRKPDSLMFEKAIAKFNIDLEASWMIGDKERDLVPALKVGFVNRMQVDNPVKEGSCATHYAKDLLTGVQKHILK